MSSTDDEEKILSFVHPPRFDISFDEDDMNLEKSPPSRTNNSFDDDELEVYVINNEYQYISICIYILYH